MAATKVAELKDSRSHHWLHASQVPVYRTAFHHLYQTGSRGAVLMEFTLHIRAGERKPPSRSIKREEISSWKGFCQKAYREPAVKFSSRQSPHVSLICVNLCQAVQRSPHSTGNVLGLGRTMTHQRPLPFADQHPHGAGLEGSLSSPVSRGCAKPPSTAANSPCCSNRPGPYPAF